MDGHKTYDYETMIAAARAVVNGGMVKHVAMARFGIASSWLFEIWWRLYLGGGVEALGLRPKDRLRGSCAAAAMRMREEELEREICRVEGKRRA